MRKASHAVKRKFDCIPHKDPRSRKFNVLACLPSDAKPFTKMWKCPVSLDQGAEGACVGFGVAHEAASDPVRVPGIANEVAHALYRRAQALDEIDGVDYEGSTLLGGMKAGVEAGYYTEYRWAFSVEDLILAICNHGPAVLSVNWHANMQSPDEWHCITASGRVIGRHCITAIGYNHRIKMVRLKNSWGPKWGHRGECWIGLKSLKRLAQDGGEAAIPINRLSGKDIPNE